MKYLWIISIIFLGGCAVTQPHISEYRLTPKIVQKQYDAKKCTESSLKVAKVFSSNILMSKKMQYIQNKYEESSFTQSQWARTPNSAISDALVKSIRKSRLFVNVSSFKSRAKTDLLLETNVEKFMQYFDAKNEKSYVEIVLTLNLLHIKSAKSKANTTIGIKVDAKSADAKGGVEALNGALSKTLLETNNWLNGVCK